MVIKKKKNKHLWTLPAVTTLEVIVRKAIKMKVLIIDEPHTTWNTDQRYLIRTAQATVEDNVNASIMHTPYYS